MRQRTQAAYWTRITMLLLSMVAMANIVDAQEQKRYQVQGGQIIDVGANVNLLDEASMLSDSTRNAILALSDTLTRAQKREIVRSQKEKDPYITLRDSMPISRVALLSVPLPGFSQIYNKQYYKLPILYAATATGTALFINQNKKYNNYKAQYDNMIAYSDSRDNIDPVQTKMIEYNTRRQLLLVGTIASYLYFIGDGAINYKYETSSIKMATTLSTICPGAGQIYNKSFWKVPIVLGGFATMGYVIDYNNRGYKRFKTAYDLLTDDDDLTIDEFNGRYSESVILNMKDSYRRNRDLCIIITGAFYLLNIIDAHVDAHLKDYDISDDISSISIMPTTFSNLASSFNSGGYGITICYSF